MSYIRKDFIDRLIESVDIVDYIGRRQELKKKGSNYFCRSPFNEDKTASCAVSPVKQIFKDFSSGKSGNVVSYIMELERCDFLEAIKKLAQFKGWDVEYESEEFANKHREKIERITEQRPVLQSAVKKYKEELKKLPLDHPAKLEIAKREYTDEEILEWEIGFAPGNKFIYNLCVNHGVQKLGQQIGLISESNDKYWNRLIYPIKDENGQLVGIAGRDLSGEEKSAKWINPVDSDLYHKEQILFGLHQAKSEINRTSNVWVVEGYNDVIAWHRYGIVNTVAPCGTSITDRQIEKMKRLASKVTLCLDADKAGIKSALRHIPLLIAAGLSVDVCQLPDSDPDDFVRMYKTELAEVELKDLVKDFIIDGFKFFMQTNLQGSDVDKAHGVKAIAEVIAMVPDQFLKETYIGWLAKESKFSKKNITDAVEQVIKDRKAVAESKVSKEGEEWFHWPKGIQNEKKAEYQKMMDRYGFFQCNGRIWKADGLSAEPISNFEIQIIQHMNDSKMPMKLVWIKNVNGKEAVFDTESSNFNSLLSFKNAVTSHGNYKFKGNNNDLDMVTDYLFDDMGVGRKIDVLGWQKDANCWVWNNGVTIPGEGTKDMDANGVFTKDDTTYYVPSANEIYKNSPWQFQSQKNFRLVGGDISFSQYFALLRDVHRDHAISSSLFALASIFQDIIADRFHFFPIQFLYGPASSGKSQLALACQSLFGFPQSQINLGQNSTTDKAKIREFAQFSNSIGILNEYKGGLPGVDDMIKGLWDRQGYKRGTLDSKVATEEVPILSSVLMTGNYYPSNEIVITRIIAEEMTKDKFSNDDKKKFELLEDAMKSGVSRITQEVLHQRKNFEENFAKEFRIAKEHIASTASLKGLQERFFQNAAVYAATNNLLAEKFSLPFNKLEMYNHFEKVLLAQRKKVEYSSTVSRFWDLFLVGIRGAETIKLKSGLDYKLEGSILFIRYSEVYSRIQTEWWSRYQEACPAKMQLKADLRDSQSYMGNKPSEPMAPGRGSLVTSVEMFDLKRMDNYEDILHSVEVQVNAQKGFEFPEHEVPESEKPKELPF